MEPKVCNMHDLFARRNKAGTLDPRTKESFMQSMRFTGHINPPESVVVYDETLLSAKEVAALPAGVNWREKLKSARAVDAVFNQGSCGCCYSWASMTSFAYRISHLS